MLLQLVMLVTPILAAAAGPLRADDVTGTWDITAEFSIVGGPADGQSTEMKAALHLIQKGAGLTGTFVPYAEDWKTEQPSLPITNGRVKGSTVTFRVQQNAGTSLTFTLVLAEGRLRGDAAPNREIDGGGKLTIKVDATRRR